MLRSRAFVITMLTLALGAAACSSSDTPDPATPTSSAEAVCQEACSGKEVTDTGCDQNAVDAVLPRRVEVENVHGLLSIRKSNPAVCEHIYWTRFQPDANSLGAFELSISVDGRGAKPQASEPGNPTLAAWTVGVYAQTGQPIRGCLTVGDRGVCLDTTAV